MHPAPVCFLPRLLDLQQCRWQQPGHTSCGGVIQSGAIYVFRTCEHQNGADISDCSDGCLRLYRLFAREGACRQVSDLPSY